MKKVKINDRIKREELAYDQGLNRDLYEKILSHCGHKSNVNRNKIVLNLMQLKAENGLVLELGSQLWQRWIDQFGINPKEIHCINISSRELEKGINYSKNSFVKPKFNLMDANNLKYKDESFDVVFGGGMLHHLEFEKAIKGVLRVLKKDGIAIFVEPLNINIISKLIRILTPKQRTNDEVPLERKHLSYLSKVANCTFIFEQFTSVPLGLVSGLIMKKPENFITNFADKMDKYLLDSFPSLGPYYRSTTIIIKKMNK